MAEYVVRLKGDDVSVDVFAVVGECQAAMNAPAALPSDLRVSDPAEASAVADLAAAMRDVLASPDVVTYHVCRHDEGDGQCEGVETR